MRTLVGRGPTLIRKERRLGFKPISGFVMQLIITADSKYDSEVGVTDLTMSDT